MFVQLACCSSDFITKYMSMIKQFKMNIASCLGLQYIKDDVRTPHQPSLDNNLRAIKEISAICLCLKGMCNPSTKVSIAEINKTSNLVMNFKYSTSWISNKIPTNQKNTDLVISILDVKNCYASMD